MSTHDLTVQPDTVAPKRPLLIACGYIFFALGMAGTVLPVMPTTIFWIIAAFCFARGSTRMYQKIMNCPRVGPVVEDFVEHGVVSRRSKTIALTGMIFAAAIITLAPMALLPTVASLAGIAVGACFVLTRPGKAI